MKKRKNILIIVTIILIILLIIPSFSCISHAIDTNTYKPTSGSGLGSMQDKVGAILGIITTIGVTVSVGALIVIGIKYMFGSVEEKAQYKETFKPYIIGAFLVFTVTLLPQLIYTIVIGLF